MIKKKFLARLFTKQTFCSTNMYHFIFQSRKPEAKKFRRWVFHEVLPSIRKYGYYVAPNQKLITIEGDKNFEVFKANYPEDTIGIKDEFDYFNPL